MQRILSALLLVLIFAVTAWSQDTGGEAEATGATEAEQEPSDSEEADDVEEEEDDSDLDEENYADIADDDFRPSEDIPADQSIPFPTDI